MKWVNEFGREITWNPGEPWPTELPEESAKRQRRYVAEQHGGYWCDDGEHYTFKPFANRSCCNDCANVIDHYCSTRRV